MAIEVIEKTETLEELGITLEWVKTNAPDLAEKLPDNEALAKKLFVGKASKEFQAQYEKVLNEIKERFQQSTQETDVPEPVEEQANYSNSEDTNESTGYGILETIIQAAMNVPIDLQDIQLDIQEEHKERFLKSVFNGFGIPIKDGKVKPMDIYNRLG